MLQAKTRTTVYLPKSLIEMAKYEAISRRMTVTQLVEDGLRKEIGIRKEKTKKTLGTYNLGKYKFDRTDAYE